MWIVRRSLFGWNLQGLQLPWNVMASFISLQPAWSWWAHLCDDKTMNRKNGYEMVNLVEHDDFTFLQVCRSSQLMMITISNDTQAQYIWRPTQPNSWNGQTMMIIVIKQNMYINFYNWRSTLPNYSSSNSQTMMITVTKHKQNISTPI